MSFAENESDQSKLDTADETVNSPAKTVATAKSSKKSWKQQSAKWIRWLHLYGSMFSCAIVLFFSVTGITLNHPSWLGGDNAVVRESKGELKPEWLTANAPESNDGIAKLEIVEFLREHERVHGSMKDFTVDETQCIVAFRAPGYTADVFIDRQLCSYELVESSMGLVAIMNDLHKGRDSGQAWAWLIDLSAVLLIFVSLTGLLLLLYINRHRKAGLLTAALGILLTVLFYAMLVPS